MGSPAAYVGGNHICPAFTGDTPHVGGQLLPGANATVLVRGRPAVVKGDTALCNGPPDTVLGGSNSVLIAGRPAARMGDQTAHGGTIAEGESTVLIG